MAPNDNTPADETLFGTDESTSSTPTTTSTPYAAEPATESPADSAASASPAPRKRATRRTTKKAAAVAEAASAPVEPAIDTSAEPTIEPASAAPVKRAVRKRAPRRQATAPVTTPESAASAETVTLPETATLPETEASPDAAELPDSVELPETAAVELPEAEAVELPETEAVELPETEAVELPETEAVELPEAVALPEIVGLGTIEDEDAGQASPEGEAPAEPVIPSFSVLFQPPDPAAATTVQRIRRRPAPVEEEPAPEEVEQDELERDQRGTTEGDHEGDDSTEDESTPRRARRRRGGKGRRGRAGFDGDEAEDEDSLGAGASGDSGLDTGPDSGLAPDSDTADRQEARAVQADEGGSDEPDDAEGDHGSDDEGGTSRRRRRRRRGGSSDSGDEGSSGSSASTRVRAPRAPSDEPTAVRGSTRLEAKKQRRREGREAGRRRTVITEAEFLARREAVDRVMVVRNKDGRTQMGVLEDGVLVEHYIDQATNVSMAGNIYLGRVQNVLPSMEAAFVDIGKGRNAVLYAGEVNWDAAGLEAGQPRRIEHALGAGQAVLVQVTKDPIGHKGARLTSQISLPGRYLVYIPNSQMTGISRKLPEGERARLKKILREVVPGGGGVIVRTAAEGASEAEIRADVERLTTAWDAIQARSEVVTSVKAGKSKGKKKNGGSGSSPTGNAPMLLHGEPDLTVRVIRDVFNEDFKELIVSGDQAWAEIHPYITSVAPDLADRVTKWTGPVDLFTQHRVDEQLAKAMDRKVWLPSGGSLVIDRTEAMTVVDVNTGKFVGSGGNLEETVTKNNIEAAEEIVRQLRLRDIGGIIVVDFIDMVLEANRELVVRRLLECLGRDRTKHQVAEVTSLGLVQMTRKRVGSGLIEVFSETCEHCNGRGFIIHSDPVDRGVGAEQAVQSGSSGGSSGAGASSASSANSRGRRGRRGGDPNAGNDAGQGNGHANGHGNGRGQDTGGTSPVQAEPPRPQSGPTAAQIAAAAHAAAIKGASPLALSGLGERSAERPQDAPAEMVAEQDTDARPVEEPARSVKAPAHFPNDDGPWSGDDAHEVPAGASIETMVELESDVPGATDDQVAAVAPTELTPVATAAPTTGSRPRRRRGRVVAPAGPPRHID